jgi:hypothetical protein
MSRFSGAEGPLGAPADSQRIPERLDPGKKRRASPLPTGLANRHAAAATNT